MELSQMKKRTTADVLKAGEGGSQTALVDLTPATPTPKGEQLDPMLAAIRNAQAKAAADTNESKDDGWDEKPAAPAASPAPAPEKEKKETAPKANGTPPPPSELRRPVGPPRAEHDLLPVQDEKGGWSTKWVPKGTEGAFAAELVGKSREKRAPKAKAKGDDLEAKLKASVAAAAAPEVPAPKKRGRKPGPKKVKAATSGPENGGTPEDRLRSALDAVVTAKAALATAQALLKKAAAEVC